MARQRILSGMRPSGPLHLGHYVGALKNWVNLQEEYECYFLIADYHALSDNINDIDRVRQSVLDVALDWLAVGLDPERSAFVVQSYVPEHAELTMYLSMLATYDQLRRNPTLKSEIAQIKAEKEPITVGFFIYPVSQAADIMLPKANLVPVGRDQEPHIELTRGLARKFNDAYGEVFPIPASKYGDIGRLVGVDGQAKMSKSLNNAIYLSDSADQVRDRIRRYLVTDTTRQHPRLRATDPGVPEYNVAFDYLDAFDPDVAEVADLKERYRAGTVSDLAVKERLIDVLNDFLEPIRERRARFAAQPDAVREALLSGSQREKKIAEATIQEVREAMRIIYT